MFQHERPGDQILTFNIMKITEIEISGVSGGSGCGCGSGGCVAVAAKVAAVVAEAAAV